MSDKEEDQTQQKQNQYVSLLAGTLQVVKANGWPSTLLVIALFATWHVWSWFEPIAVTIVSTHIAALGKLSDNNTALVESDKKKTEIIESIQKEQVIHNDKLDSHGLKIDEVIKMLSRKGSN